MTMPTKEQFREAYKDHTAAQIKQIIRRLRRKGRLLDEKARLSQRIMAINDMLSAIDAKQQEANDNYHP